MSYFRRNKRGQMHLATGTTLAFGGTDTYEKIVGTWTDGFANYFTVDDANDRLTYTGPSGVIALMNGISDVSSDKACLLTYGLYKNGSLVTGAETPHDIASAAKTATMAISTLIELTHNDYFEVWAKSDTASTTITINSLKILFFGEC